MLHDTIELIEDGYSDEAAIEKSWRRWGHHLAPEDLALLADDIEKFHARDFDGVRTVLSEGEIRVPLTTLPDGRPVFFRGRIDRLYERLDRPGSFIHVDYKSSKWLKTQDEIEEDLQLSAYNVLLCEYFPEIEELAQYMDQFRGGLGEPVFKTEEQRAEIRRWLEVEARAYFADVPLQEDGLPAPRFNRWCPWCPILEDCRIIPQLSDWARERIALLNPELVPQETPMSEYIANYDDAQTAIKTLQRYEESVKELVRETPESGRQALGFKLEGRRNSVISAGARMELLETLGTERFLAMARVTKGALEGIEDPDVREWALSLVEKVPGPRVVKRLRR
jgi:hypothetical protein